MCCFKALKALTQQADSHQPGLGCRSAPLALVLVACPAPLALVTLFGGISGQSLSPLVLWCRFSVSRALGLHIYLQLQSRFSATDLYLTNLLRMHKAQHFWHWTLIFVSCIPQVVKFRLLKHLRGTPPIIHIRVCVQVSNTACVKNVAWTFTGSCVKFLKCWSQCQLGLKTTCLKIFKNLTMWPDPLPWCRLY